MAKHIRNGDLDTTWNIASSNDKWVLTKSAEIVTNGEAAIFQSSSFSNDKIVVRGDLFVSNVTKAIDLAGDDTTLNISSTSVITTENANVGVYGGGHNFLLNNFGKITGQLSGVYLGDDALINNHGTINSAEGIYAVAGELELSNDGRIVATGSGVSAFATNSTIINTEAGKISAGDFGIEFRDGGDGIVRNFGKISSDIAIFDMDGDSRVFNRGLIEGSIQLGAGEDLFDTRKGTVIGSIDAGDGADTYIVSDAHADILEQANHGQDTVKSTVSFQITDNLENLFLLGKGDINGRGNSGNNSISGNSGDNVLRGMGGSDNFVSGSGNDIMIGGKGADLFEFNSSANKDVVVDFQNDKDVIHSEYVQSELDFQDMLDNHLFVKGDDLVVKYDTDILRLKNMDADDLDSSDFLVL